MTFEKGTRASSKMLEIAWSISAELRGSFVDHLSSHVDEGGAAMSQLIGISSPCSSSQSPLAHGAVLFSWESASWSSSWSQTYVSYANRAGPFQCSLEVVVLPYRAPSTSSESIWTL